MCGIIYKRNLRVFILLHLVLISNSEVLLQAGNEEVRPCVKVLLKRSFYLCHLSYEMYVFPTLFSADAEAVLRT